MQQWQYLCSCYLQLLNLSKNKLIKKGVPHKKMFLAHIAKIVSIVNCQFSKRVKFVSIKKKN